MKTFIFVFCMSGAAFLVLGYQTGILDISDDEDETVAVEVAAEQSAPQALFPDDLAPACQGVAVPAAAPYDPHNGRPPRLAFFFAG